MFASFAVFVHLSVIAFPVNGPCCLWIGFALQGASIFAIPPLGFSQQQTACFLAIRWSDVMGNPHSLHICDIVIFLPLELCCQGEPGLLLVSGHIKHIVYIFQTELILGP